MVDLLEGSPGEARLVFDEVFQMRLGLHLDTPTNRLVPGQVGPGPHGVDAGEPADVPRQDSVESEHEAWRRNDRAVTGRFRVGGITPQRIVVSDSVGVVADVVAVAS